MPGEDGLAHQYISVRKSIHDFEQTSVLSDDRTFMAVRCNASVDDATAELELPWRFAPIHRRVGTNGWTL
jgi:hypothetical protein